LSGIAAETTIAAPRSTYLCTIAAGAPDDTRRNENRTMAREVRSALTGTADADDGRSLPAHRRNVCRGKT
jgi:hypothetical protein